MTNGSRIVLTGSNFGADSSKITIVTEVWSCTDVRIEQDNDQVSCLAGGGSGSLNIQITVDGQSANSTLIYQSTWWFGILFTDRLLDPSITAISQPPTQGGAIQIDGFNFGSSQGLVSVMVGGVVCDNVQIALPDFSITCLAPYGTGTKTVQVNVNNLEGDSTLAYQSK